MNKWYSCPRNNGVETTLSVDHNRPFSFTLLDEGSISRSAVLLGSSVFSYFACSVVVKSLDDFYVV